MSDELVEIKGLYAYINIPKYRSYLYRVVHYSDLGFTESDMPLKVHAIYPATDLDSTWVGVTFPSGTITSFPIDLVSQFTNHAPVWYEEDEPSNDVIDEFPDTSEVTRYRRMLYTMASRTEWQQAGYDVAEYDALVEEFEGGDEP